jgi:hypothetical protein
MIRKSHRPLRVEPLEDRWLLASSLQLAHVTAGQLTSSVRAQVELPTHSESVGDQNGSTSLFADAGSTNSESDATEYQTGGTKDETGGGTTTSERDSPDEYRSTGSALSNVRHENPYFFDNKSYAVVAIPPPPALVTPRGSVVSRFTPELQPVTDPGANASTTVSAESANFSVPSQAVAVSNVPSVVPESLPEMPTDPPPTEQQENPTTPPPDDSTPQPGSTPAALLDDLPITLNVAEWEHAAKRLLDGLDRVLIDATDLDSPIVRLGYWIGTAAAVGVAVELTRRGLQPRRPRLDLRLSARLPVN